MDKKICIQINTLPDKLERQQFYLYWRDSDFMGKETIRGQVFFCNPDEYVKTYREKGYEIIPVNNYKKAEELLWTKLKN